MSPHAVLAVHAAGDPHHPEGSGQLFDWLGRELGSDYRVLAPTMPEPDEPHYRPWRDRIEQELGTIQDSVILFGHSFGGSVLVKYLAEGSLPVVVCGLFLASVPYWGPGGWEYDVYDLPDDFANNMPRRRSSCTTAATIRRFRTATWVFTPRSYLRRPCGR